MKNTLLAIVLFGGSLVVLFFLGKDVPPTSPFFPVERLEESAVLLTKRSPEDKISYYQYLITKRFSDIKYVVDTDHTDILVAVSLRYGTTVGKAVQIASLYTVKKSELKSQLESQKKKLQVIIQNYKRIDKRQKYIEDDVNYITAYEKEL